ncbi:MAG: hypothetical protein PHN59_05690 [Candidatus Omnitrophica bacterium]|nr:hypothetical protein [Candidatus Omnitrophota bacterium]
MKNKHLLFVIWLLSFVILLSGCDAFVRKFTRKPKKDAIQKEEMVLEPQEYQPTMTKEQLYRQYFLFWQSWQDELIEALARSTNHKKQVSCVDQAMKNLLYLRNMLNPEKQKQLDVYVSQLQDLQDSIKQDTYGTNVFISRSTADRLKMRIRRDFSYDKVKGYLS